jgi:hypothetical protein
MTMSASGLFITTQLDQWDATQLGMNLATNTLKCALFLDTIANDLSTDTAYGVSPYNANEVPGTGNYTTGGATLGSQTFTALNVSQATLNAASTTWASSTISNARGALIYNSTVAGNRGLCLVNFGAAYSTISGTFTITWNAAGIFYIDCY